MKWKFSYYKYLETKRDLGFKGNDANLNLSLEGFISKKQLCNE